MWTWTWEKQEEEEKVVFVCQFVGLDFCCVGDCGLGSEVGEEWKCYWDAGNEGDGEGCCCW